MGTTVHEKAARAALDRMMADPAEARILPDTYAAMRDGHWSAGYIDAIGQSGRWTETPMEQLAAFAHVHAMITKGDVSMVVVRTGGPPSSDAHREANAAKLADLPRPFTASVDMEQNRGDCGDTQREPAPKPPKFPSGFLCIPS